MAIEVEGKIFSTGNNPSLQRLMDLWEGSHHTCSSNRWKNVFDLIDWNFYPNRTMFFFPSILTKNSNLKQPEWGEENLSIPIQTFWSKILWRILVIDKNRL